jgi:hypothetical protein
MMDIPLRSLITSTERNIISMMATIHYITNRIWLADKSSMDSDRKTNARRIVYPGEGLWPDMKKPETGFLTETCKGC